ncbi:MAG: branched-chain amino acid ABC transporter permease [Shinella sp.]|nr:branched-chain amino acid ABC transporter permease [Shinella sp.]
MKHNILTAALLIGFIALMAVVTHLLGIRLYDRVVTNLMISLVLVVGLQTFMGNSGILSFAHVGFMGLGAYTSAVLTIPAQMKGMALPDLYPAMKVLEVHPVVGVLAGGIVAALVAAAVAYPLMRLSDAAAVITSFALLVVLHTVMNNWSAFTNGPRTLFGLPKATDMPIAAAVAGLAVVVALFFKESKVGKLLRASREDEVAAAAMGANIPKLRWQAFILAAFIAGIGGALWGHFITSFAPKSFFLKETFVIISMLVIGGANTVTGAVAGAVLVTLVYESLRGLEGLLNSIKIMGGQVIGLTEIVLAIAMIAVMILRPGGLFPSREIGHLITRIRRKRETSA